jgi:hypothetical protein
MTPSYYFMLNFTLLRGFIGLAPEIIFLVTKGKKGINVNKLKEVFILAN